jgi:predicted nucleotide-binding protein (sugar kinase/HSP70/actin superfamily)
VSHVVGIPRGLFYYKYYPLWKSFFEEMGAELAVSPQTNRGILDCGIASCVGEACLPLKAYFGHALALADRADMLFVPRYMSVAPKEFICPKFGGLPDMVKSSLKGLPQLLSPEVNLHDRADGGLRAALEAGRALGAGRVQAKRAYERAVQAYLHNRAAQVGTSLGTEELPQNKAASGSGPEGKKLRILLLGHAYTVGDRFINMEIVRKLNSLGAEAVALEHFDGRDLRQAAEPLAKPLFWSYGTEALGSAYLLTARRPVDGVLHLTCFGCGVDSFVGYLFERRVRQGGIPFATVSLDEHTGEAGLQTRLEAFTDTLSARRAGA